MVTSSSMFVDGRAKKIIMLVGGLEHFLFSLLLGRIIPTDELIFFRGVYRYTMVYHQPACHL